MRWASGTNRRAIPEERGTTGTAKAVTLVKATGAGWSRKGSPSVFRHSNLPLFKK